MTNLGYAGAPGPVIPWSVLPPLDPGGRYPVTCETSLGGVAHECGVTPPRTCLQNLADGVILLEKQRGGNTTSLPT